MYPFCACQSRRRGGLGAGLFPTIAGTEIRRAPGGSQPAPIFSNPIEVFTSRWRLPCIGCQQEPSRYSLRATKHLQELMRAMVQASRGDLCVLRRYRGVGSGHRSEHACQLATGGCGLRYSLLNDINPRGIYLKNDEAGIPQRSTRSCSRLHRASQAALRWFVGGPEAAPPSTGWQNAVNEGLICACISLSRLRPSGPYR